MTSRPTRDTPLPSYRIRMIALSALAAVALAFAALAPQIAAWASGTTAGETVGRVFSTSPGERGASEFGIDAGAVGDEPMSPFDDQLPGIANLTPPLRSAVQAAATAAIDDGFDFHIRSGWRSAEYQQALFDEAVVEYGSVEEASRLVSTPERSKHVTGDAVDIGPTDADSWMSQHGADYGLCQTYSNEMWHFELMTTPGGDCPVPLPDASAG